MSRGAVLALVTVALTISPAYAAAESVSATYEVRGGSQSECSPEYVSYALALPPRATNIKPAPKDGTTWWFGEFRFAEVDGIDYGRGKRNVTWNIGAWDLWENRVPCVWSVGPVTFTATFDVVSPRPPLNRRLAKRAVKPLLKDKFNWGGPFSPKDRLSCGKKVAQNTRVCKFATVFVFAKGKGRVRVSLFSRPDTRLYAKLRYRGVVRGDRPGGGSYVKRISGKKRVGLGYP